MCCYFLEKCTNSHKTGLGCSTPLRAQMTLGIFFCLFYSNPCLQVWLYAFNAQPTKMMELLTILIIGAFTAMSA